jgi:hypothetical protein
MKKEEKYIIELIKFYGSASTWWFSEFYEEFCLFYNLDQKDIKKNGNKIRLKLNNLVKKGYLIKLKTGTGEGGKKMYGFNSSNHWQIKK